MKGILFTEANFHATIQGRKTQTRRIIKPQPCELFHGTPIMKCDNQIGVKDIPPRHKIGDKLYLKEPYSFGLEDEAVYKYSSTEIPGYKWQNKLYMPARYARHFIKIIDVRAERLQDISDDDCLAEGVYKTEGRVIGYPFGIPFIYKYPGGKHLYTFPREAYAAQIDAISGKGTWEANPYVWVYEYELLK